MDTSQRSTRSSRRRPVRCSVRAFSGRKPMERPSMAPSRHQRMNFAGAGDGERELPADEEPAASSLRLSQRPSGFGRIMLPEQPDAGRTTARQGSREKRRARRCPCRDRERRTGWHSPQATVSGDARRLHRQKLGLERQAVGAVHPRFASRFAKRLRSFSSFARLRTKLENVSRVAPVPALAVCWRVSLGPRRRPAPVACLHGFSPSCRR